MNSRYTRIAVKIGSNVLTRKDGTLDITRMSALVDQIAELHHRGIGVIMISSGAVASGRSELRENKKLDAVSARQLYSAVGQAKLINRYYELFREHGIACGQVLTTKENFSTRRHYLNQKHCMEVMLAKKRKLSELTAPVTLYPQLLVNVRVTDKKLVMAAPLVIEAVKKAEAQLEGNGRMLVRESGTEPLVRVMAEAADIPTCEQCIKIVTDAIAVCGYVVSE